jgi:ribosomal protein L11 methyltransferase
MTTTRLTYLVPAEREDDVVAELWEAGTLGVQVLAAGEPGTVRLEAYFDGPGPGKLPGELPGAQLLGSEPVPPTDWLAPWREAARPFAVGERWWLDPRDPDLPGAGGDDDVPPGRRLLRIPARAAFGTGSHESTRLVLELLDAMDLAGRRVLDVGTGTGLLAFAALLSGARSAVAFDADPAAPCHARENARRNGLALPLFAGTAAALSAEARFDLALVNVIPEEIAADLPHLAALLAPAGEAIFSGILAAAGPRSLAALAAAGFTPFAERADGEWVAYRVRR